MDQEYIPDDGSAELISAFCEHSDCDMFIYPDVHLKRNSKMANGTLISSRNQIYLSCLGVENCGFTFGKVNESNRDKLVESFKKYAEFLKNRHHQIRYTQGDVMQMFESRLLADYNDRKFLYDFLGFATKEEMISQAKKIISGWILKKASDTLCTLGGGNHFFEIHEIVENYSKNELFNTGRFFFMLHSDSIAVGDLIFNLYSDLFEMTANSSGTVKSKIRIALFKLYRKLYYHRIGLSYKIHKKELDKFFKHSDDYQYIDADSVVGKSLLFAHNISSLFGEMNRDEILNNWVKFQNINIETIGSHSHDSVSVEMHNGEIKIVHRNGVQNIGEDKYCILPGAMGSYSYILENARNNEAYFSTNHGTGRIQDKHIAKKAYTEQGTEQDLNNRNICLFRAGEGNLAEQNRNAFKNPYLITEEMQKYNLAKPIAKTCPIAIIKG